MFSFRQIAHVVLVIIGFLLKGYASVCLMPVAYEQESDKKLQDIEQIETCYEQFFLLRPVDVLVPDVSIRQPHTLSHEYHVKDGDGLVATRGQNVVLYNFHGCTN